MNDAEILHFNSIPVDNRVNDLLREDDCFVYRNGRGFVVHTRRRATPDQMLAAVSEFCQREQERHAADAEAAADDATWD